MSLIRKQFYLSQEEEHWLKKQAARRRSSEASLLREVLDKYRFETENQPETAWVLDGVVGMVKGKDGVTDEGINHDHYLYGAPKKRPQRPG